MIQVSVVTAYLRFSFFCKQTEHPSFPTIHRVGNIGIFVLLKFEVMLDRKVNHFNFNLKYQSKCKLALKLIRLSTVSNIFSLEVVQTSQRCQLCAIKGPKGRICNCTWVLLVFFSRINNSKENAFPQSTQIGQLEVFVSHYVRIS